MSDDLSCRLLRPDEAARALDLFYFLQPMHAEVGLAPVNFDKAVRHIGWAIENGRVFILTSGEAIIGSVGLAPGEFWYATRKILLSNWAYVTPAWRESKALRVLLSEIVDMVEEDQTPVFLHFFGGKKLQPDLRKVAEELAIFPSGEIFLVEPKRAV